MFNSTTEETIKQIPAIEGIEVDRLPQELTRIYALIVGLRRQYSAGTINYESPELFDGVALLQKLANNLETILLTNPGHQQRTSIAFVAGTAHSLLHRIGRAGDSAGDQLWPDTISSFISAILLFLIANSQPDAAEMASQEPPFPRQASIKAKLTANIQSLAKGTLSDILDAISDAEIDFDDDLTDYAYNLLWGQLNAGIETIALILMNRQTSLDPDEFFNRVLALAVSEESYFDQQSVFGGPYHLAKLLSILGGDILQRAVAKIEAPPGIDPILWPGLLEQIAASRPYLWDNHLDAVKTGFLTPGVSAVMTLPTGAGKSTLSELKIASCLFSGKRVVYLVPTHALEDQVSRNLQALFRGYVTPDIEMDGEYTELTLKNDSPILVMTPERCLTMFNIFPNYFKKVGLVVFDEFHLIHGKGTSKDQRPLDAMFCLLSLFDSVPTADYLLISAMVENGKEVQGWIAKVTGRLCQLFDSTWKPTRQLHGCVLYDEDAIKRLQESVSHAKAKKTTKGPPSELKRSMNAVPYCFFSLRNMWQSKEMKDYAKVQMLDQKVLLGLNPTWNLTSNRNEVAATLGAHYALQRLKTLVFADNPRNANSICNTIKAGLALPEGNFSGFQRKFSDRFRSLTKELGGFQYSYLYQHVDVVIHHGLLLPVERFLTEQYFKEPDGAVALVATATLAQGINLPAEMVIIAGDDRYDKTTKGRENVDAHELLNAAGRAGRAGHSSQGAVIIIPGDIVTMDTQKRKLSDRWWELKETFSNSDQCLKIEDPLEFFLDTMETANTTAEISKGSLLFRIKSEKYSPGSTQKLLARSFYAYKAGRKGKQEEFSKQVKDLLVKKEAIDKALSTISWHQELSLQTGISPRAIDAIAKAISAKGVENIIEMTVVKIIEWYMNWLKRNWNFLTDIFTKESTLDSIRRCAGIPEQTVTTQAIANGLPMMRDLLIAFVTGKPMKDIEKLATGKVESPLAVARQFVLKLVPELSFSFGLLSMIVEKLAREEKITQKDLPITIRYLATFIREGVDKEDKLNFKLEHPLLSRVECHEHSDEDI